MKKDFQQFLAAYEAATPEIKTIIDSEQIGLFAGEIITEPQGIQKRQIIVCVSNCILNIITDSELVDELEQLGIGAESIAKAKVFVDQQTAASVPITPTSAPTSSIQEDLAEIEKSLHQISPVRTMVSDSKQVGYSSSNEDTYTSTQSAIINESK